MAGERRNRTGLYNNSHARRKWIPKLLKGKGNLIFRKGGWDVFYPLVRICSEQAKASLFKRDVLCEAVVLEIAGRVVFATPGDFSLAGRSAGGMGGIDEERSEDSLKTIVRCGYQRKKPTHTPRPEEGARRADRERRASLRNVDHQSLLIEGDQKKALKQYAVFKRVSMSDVEPRTQFDEYVQNNASPRYIFNRYRLQAMHEARSRGEQIAWAVSPYPQLNREFQRISLAWVNLPESVEIGCAASSSAIDNFFREPGKIGFQKRFIEVLAKHSHLEIDCLEFGKP